ncbi:MAG: glucokinase [Desulfovibrio sp.]
MKEKTYILADIGGTNTRFALARYEQNACTYTKHSSAPLNNVRELYTAFHQLTAENDIAGVVLGVAAAVSENSATPPNWKDNNTIVFSELAGPDCIPVFALNDLEAAAWGINSCPAIHLFGPPLPPHSTREKVKNKILIAPGTGLGCAAIINGTPQAAEFQHSAIPAINPIHRTVIDWIQETYNKDIVSWEDCVSGYGLESIYEALSNIDMAASVSKRGAAKLTASQIGKKALYEKSRGTFGTAYHALKMYYQCLARFSQVAALAYMAKGGVYISGASTLYNRPFITTELLQTEFLKIEKQQDFIRSIPLFIVEKDMVFTGLEQYLRHLIQEQKV